MKTGLMSVVKPFLSALVAVGLSQATFGLEYISGAVEPFTLEGGQVVKLTGDTTIRGADATKDSCSTPAITVSNASDFPAAIIIPKGMTLTVTGGNGFGKLPASPGIQLEHDEKTDLLIVCGEGTLIAKGGNAGDRETPGKGMNGDANHGKTNHQGGYGGAGGKGGDGSGGAAPGIGGRGGFGGEGGAGGAKAEIYVAGFDHIVEKEANVGENGQNGHSGESMGSLFAIGSVTVLAEPGSVTVPSGDIPASAPNGEPVTRKAFFREVFTAPTIYRAGLGGGGGGYGGFGGKPEYNIGGGGGGGGGGAGGTSGALLSLENDRLKVTHGPAGRPGGSGRMVAAEAKFVDDGSESVPCLDTVHTAFLRGAPTKEYPNGQLITTHDYIYKTNVVSRAFGGSGSAAGDEGEVLTYGQARVVTERKDVSRSFDPGEYRWFFEGNFPAHRIYLCVGPSPIDYAECHEFCAAPNVPPDFTDESHYFKGYFTGENGTGVQYCGENGAPLDPYFEFFEDLYLYPCFGTITEIPYEGVSGSDSCQAYQRITTGGARPTEWGSGWYVISGEVVFTNGIHVTGSANLLLMDNAVLKVNGGEGESAITISEGARLKVFNQSGRSGRMYAVGAPGCAGISGEGDFEINARTVGHALAGPSVSVLADLAVGGDGLVSLTDACCVAVCNRCVEYLDRDVSTKVCTDFSVIDSGHIPTQLEDGRWYVVDGEVALSNSELSVSGHANLILKNGSSFSIDAAYEHPGIYVPFDASLTIYGQTNGTGRLSVSGSFNSAGIGGGDGLSSGCGLVTICGGQVSASAGGSNPEDGYVEPSAIGPGRHPGSGTAVSDRSFFVSGQCDVFTVSGGDELRPLTIMRSGAVRNAVGIGNVLITPTGTRHVQDPVEYVAGGSTETVYSYTVLETDDFAPLWEGGWYVVDGSVSYHGQVTVGGEARLILKDGSSLELSGDQPPVSLSAGSSLTIYRQEKGTGRLTVECTACDSGIAAAGGASLAVVGIANVFAGSSAGGLVRKSVGEHGAVTVGEESRWIIGDCMTYHRSDGTDGFCPEYTLIGGNSLPDRWTTGWYVVDGLVNGYSVANLPVESEGDVRLVLKDGARLVLGCTNGVNPALTVSGSLTIYAQTPLQAEVKAYGGDGCAGIGGNGDLLVNDVKLSAFGGEGAPGIGCDLKTSNAEVTAVGGRGAAGIGSAYGKFGCNVTVSGGSILAVGGEDEAFGDAQPWGIGSGANAEFPFDWSAEALNQLYVTDDLSVSVVDKELGYVELGCVAGVDYNHVLVVTNPVYLIGGSLTADPGQPYIVSASTPERAANKVGLRFDSRIAGYGITAEQYSGLYTQKVERVSGGDDRTYRVTIVPTDEVLLAQTNGVDGVLNAAVVQLPVGDLAEGAEEFDGFVEFDGLTPGLIYYVESSDRLPFGGGSRKSGYGEMADSDGRAMLEVPVQEGDSAFYRIGVR